MHFEGFGMQGWNKLTDGAQRLDKNLFISLVIMFTSRVMVVKISNHGSFFVFSADEIKKLGTI